MQFPENLRYTKDHEWIKLDGNIATVGITDFAQGELGDIVYVDISITGSELKKEEVFGTVEAVKTVSDLFLPMDGVVLEVNALLNEHPELVNKEPYEGGWMVKIKVKNTEDFLHLMDAVAYKQLIGQ